MKRLLALLILISGAASQGLAQDTDAMFEQYTAFNGVEFEYTILKPAHFDASKSYPALIAFPPGEMDRHAAEWAVENLWGGSQTEGWLIIIPTIPEQSWHTHPSHHAMNAFMDQVKKDYRIQGGKFHLTGYATGVRACVTYAGMSSEYFQTLTVAGGMGWERWDDREVKKFGKDNAGLPVRILVGEHDVDGREHTEHVSKMLIEGGADVHVTIVRGYGEGLESMLGGKMLEVIGG